MKSIFKPKAIEYGVFDKDTGELLSVTTFENRADAEDELVQIFHPSYAEVKVWSYDRNRTPVAK